MSDWAKPGVQCVCIRDEWRYIEYRGFSVPTRVPMLGEVLTVSATMETPEGRYLAFAEIPTSQKDGRLSAEIWWSPASFRPLIKRKTDISMFTRMLLSSKTPVIA